MKPEISWRTEADETQKDTPRSHGVKPSSFYAKSRSQTHHQLRQVLGDASNSVVRQSKKKVTTDIKLKRAAFKDVTSLKKWPLQEPALRELDRLLQDQASDSGEHEPFETLGDTTGLSSSSLDEPKRRRWHSDDEDFSPRKSTLRHQFRLEFLRETRLSVPVDDDVEILPPLWSTEPRIFAVELSTSGKRKYIVGHLGRFIDYYWRRCDPMQRHYYELIREKTPCRLYFDLEFSKLSNPSISEVDQETLMDEFLAELFTEFELQYGFEVKRCHVVDLDSSTKKKFSRHLIVHLSNKALFADAAAAGRFVKVFVGRLAEELSTGQLQKRRNKLANHLFVNSAPPKNPSHDITQTSETDKNTTCFVDLGVYTRNRLFRLLGSSKFGKTADAALRLAAANEFPFPPGFSNERFYVPSLKRTTGCEAKNRETVGPEFAADGWTNEPQDFDLQTFRSSVDWTAHAEALAATLVVPVNYSKRSQYILAESTDAQALTKPQSESTSSGSVPSASARRVQIGRSPFAAVDDFVLGSLASRGGVQGVIRGWSIDDDGCDPVSMTFQMSRNRWCENIGRPHKSNNIMWTIDFQTMLCTQRCHDPECREQKFRGAPVPLPDKVVDSVNDTIFERKLVALDDHARAARAESTASNTDVDDDSFEEALLALRIEDDTPRKSNVNTHLNPITTEQGTNADFGADDHLDDDVLLQAALSNPERFP